MLRIHNNKIKLGMRGVPDICEGPLTKNIIMYSLPLMASGILQLAFSAADSAVVGQFAGSKSLAAVGATGALISLIVNVLLGLSVGTSVNVAHCFGAKDNRGVSEVVHTSILTALIGGIIIGAFGYFTSEVWLGLMDTPADIIAGSALYMKIYFLGLPAMMVYNFASSILRSTGDTKNPLIFLSVAGVINIILNLVFVICFKMTVDGVAIATVVSQTVAAVLSVIYLKKVDGPHRLYFSKLKIHIRRLKKILVIGIPAGLGGTVFSVANVVIQSSVNSLGSACITGNSAAGNLEGFVCIAMNSVHQTALTFVGQHVGARKPERIKKIIRICMIYVTVVGIALSAIVFIFKRPLLGIFIPDDTEALNIGIQKATLICCTHFICGIMDVQTGILRGFGASLSPTVISLVTVCGTRLLWIATMFRLPQFHTPIGLYIGYPLSWLIAVIAQAVCLVIVKKKVLKRISALPDRL